MKNERLIAIGDIHGCYHPMVDLHGGCVFGYQLCAMIIRENGEYDFATVPKSPKDKEDS